MTKKADKDFLIWAGTICIEDAVELPDNPKNHVIALIKNSYDKFGFVRRPLINSLNNHIIAGNGRIGELLTLKNKGDQPPQGVKITTEGKWEIPVDYIELPEEQEVPLALVDNRATELGGWDQSKLAKALAKVPEGYEDTVGFEIELQTALKSFYGDKEQDPEEWGEEVAQAVSAAPSVTKKDDKKKDLAILRYVVRTETLAAFRVAIRTIMKEHEVTDISDAIDILLGKNKEGDQ